jgi:hypothetical protein
MKSITNILTLIVLTIITLLSTGCASTKYSTGEKAYDKMVEIFSLQDLDLSAPEFKSLKENMICYFDDNTSYNNATVSVCYSENDKVNFVFSTREGKTRISDSEGYVLTRKDNNFQSGERKVNCPILQRESYGFIGNCKNYSSYSSKNAYNFMHYRFRNFNNMYLINFGEKTLKEETDPTSLLPKIKEVLLKIK